MENDRDDLIEVREEVMVEAEEQSRTHMNTGQSFGEIIPRQSTNRNSNCYQGETFQGGAIAEEMLEKQMLMHEDLERYYEEQAKMGMKGDGSADFMVSNWQEQQEGGMPAGHHESKQSAERSQHSYGTGSFTTGTFNSKLVGSEGMAILKYI